MVVVQDKLKILNKTQRLCRSKKKILLNVSPDD